MPWAAGLYVVEPRHRLCLLRHHGLFVSSLAGGTAHPKPAFVTISLSLCRQVTIAGGVFAPAWGGGAAAGSKSGSAAAGRGGGRGWGAAAEVFCGLLLAE